MDVDAFTNNWWFSGTFAREPNEETNLARGSPVSSSSGK